MNDGLATVDELAIVDELEGWVEDDGSGVGVGEGFGDDVEDDTGDITEDDSFDTELGVRVGIGVGEADVDETFAVDVEEDFFAVEDDGDAPLHLPNPGWHPLPQ